jgi:hypothetical protein
MDNQRWVSDNDFRQIPQLFDGVEVANTVLPNTELLASRFWRVRTTSGDDTRLELSILHAAWNPAPNHSVAAFGYFHDQPVNGAFTGFANSSYRVVGARAEGAFSLGAVDLPYTLEAAKQRPYAGGDARIDVRYWRAGAGASWKALTLRYDEELKGSNASCRGYCVLSPRSPLRASSPCESKQRALRTPQRFCFRPPCDADDIYILLHTVPDLRSPALHLHCRLLAGSRAGARTVMSLNIPSARTYLTSSILFKSSPARNSTSSARRYRRSQTSPARGS